MPYHLNSSDAHFETEFRKLLNAKRENAPELGAVVEGILADVAHRGDDALYELTQKFDRFELSSQNIAFDAADIDAAIAGVDADEAAALDLAAERITDYHARQKPENAWWQDDCGAWLG